MSIQDVRLLMGERIKSLRINAGLSQRRLALITGVGHTFISRLERGMIENPTLKTLNKIASALDVEIVELFG